MKTVDNEPSVFFERVVNAPRALVWEAWTDPKHARHWWGPDGCTVVGFEADLRQGGSFRIDIEFGGSVTTIGGIYEDVVDRERLVTLGDFTRAGVKLCDTRRVVTFEDAGDKTKVTL
ncbi:MAG: SRPBCC domain-containing protein, partial [Candidatus Eremiobacteraeota bacterium]|nr:SRPBCC domain-containing protein [Candidatus Eremiobacteraeota bacterium]